MTELALAAQRPSTRLLVRDTLGVAKRNLLRIARTPLMLIVTAVQPALLLVLFRYVLGGAISIPGGSYVDYVVPAVFVEAVLIGGMTTSIGLATKDPETAQIAGILPFFVLMFASNAVVPVATMPGWLQGFARNQPLSVTVSATRALLEGGPAAHWVWQSLAWAAGILLVFFVASLRLYRNSTG